MADTKLPEEATPPNPLADPRTYGVVLLLASSAVPWLTEARIALIAPLAAGLAAYLFGMWQSRQRGKVVNATVAAVGRALPGETVAVPLPDGGATTVKTDPKP